jgi:hypothetical protein
MELQATRCETILHMSRPTSSDRSEEIEIPRLLFNPSSNPVAAEELALLAKKEEIPLVPVTSHAIRAFYRALDWNRKEYIILSDLLRYISSYSLLLDRKLIESMFSEAINHHNHAFALVPGKSYNSIDSSAANLAEPTFRIYETDLKYCLGVRRAIINHHSQYLPLCPHRADWINLLLLMIKHPFIPEFSMDRSENHKFKHESFAATARTHTFPLQQPNSQLLLQKTKDKITKFLNSGLNKAQSEAKEAETSLSAAYFTRISFATRSEYLATLKSQQDHAEKLRNSGNSLENHENHSSKENNSIRSGQNSQQPLRPGNSAADRQGSGQFSEYSSEIRSAISRKMEFQSKISNNNGGSAVDQHNRRYFSVKTLESRRNLDRKAVDRLISPENQETSLERPQFELNFHRMNNSELRRAAAIAQSDFLADLRDNIQLEKLLFGPQQRNFGRFDRETGPIGPFITCFGPGKGENQASFSELRLQNAEEAEKVRLQALGFKLPRDSERKFQF